MLELKLRAFRKIKDPNVIGYPIIPDDIGQLVGIRVDNDTYPFSADDACFKMLRTLKVIYWCITDNLGHVSEPYEFVQTVKVVNANDPEFLTETEGRAVCSFAADCGGVVLVDSLISMSRDAFT
jgi:hypothetical protein